MCFRNACEKVAQANERFYRAFASGKIAEMRKAWAEGKHVRVIHPNAGCIVGKEQVRTSGRKNISKWTGPRLHIHWATSHLK